MAGRWRPWWMYAVAASALSCLALMMYAEAFGPGAFGMGLRFRSGRALVVEVVPGYPADRAGIQTGDQIVAAGGLPIRNLLDWLVVADNVVVGRPLFLDTQRGPQHRGASLVFDAHWRHWTTGTWVTFVAKFTAHLVTFALALLIAVRRPRDLVALIGAVWLAAISVTDFTPIAAADPLAPTLPAGASAIWRSLPAWMTPPLWLGVMLFLLGPTLTDVFFAMFPRPVFRSKRAAWCSALLWLPLGIVAIPLLMLMHYRSVYDPAHATDILPWWFTSFVGGAVMAALAVAVTMLLVNYVRLTDPNERRRVRIVVVGLIVGLAGTAPVAMASFFDLPPAVQSAVRSPFVRTSYNVLFVALPVSFAYAILRHRLLDVGLIVRQGLQYALARRLVVSLVPACALVLLLDLFVHGDQPLLTVLQSRGWIYAAVAALALAAQARRRSWLDALDRRFFRERYDAQRLLREVVEQVRRAARVEAIAQQVVTQVEAALHPEYAALVVRRSLEPAYHALVVAPATAGRDFTLRADSTLVALARLLQKPLETAPGESGWLTEQLPGEEIALLRELRIGLIVPIAAPAGGAETMLVLGIKRSEEPYSREDRELLVAVATSLALLAERPAPAGSASIFGECPRCGACYEAGTASCENEDARLETVQLPRVLNDRYRLVRRLGRGGMGTVYEATDGSLERRVAVKVIREDLVGSADAAQRFRLEARAAASFSHPNVVTIHDFGVAVERRAFLVMELLRGASIRQVLRQEQRFTPARTLAVVRQMAAAIEAAHQRSLVHRDVKPENVFLASDDSGERVKILDFGLAKFLASDAPTATVTGAGVIVGTLHYMAPEQLRGGPVEPGWDIWSIAVMAYEMLSGALPFPSTSTIVYQNAVLAGRATPIRDHLPDATDRLQAFFDRALAMDPARRYARSPIFASELETSLY